MGFPGVLFAVSLLFPSIIAQNNTAGTLYFLAVTSQAEGGQTETLCVSVYPQQDVSLTVDLSVDEHTVTLLRENRIMRDYNRCVEFQVPVVIVESVATINLQIEGENLFLNKSTKILITPQTHLTIIQTDKPIYKPGQTMKFRIVSLDKNFLTYNQMFPTIELQDPNSNRIGQWLNVSTEYGLVDLSYPIISEAINGTYVITVWDRFSKEIKQDFEVKQYVLPKFEVTINVPPVITILDTQFTVKVCAKYTYGRPVNGTVRTTVCHNSNRHRWSVEILTRSNICKVYMLGTDKTGCGHHMLNLMDYILTDSRYQNVLSIQSEVEEDGTGVIMKASGSSFITSNIMTLSFENSPTSFKLGMNYEGKIKATGPNMEPLKNIFVVLTITVGSVKTLTRLLETNEQGIALFSLETESWGLEQVQLEAKHETIKRKDDFREKFRLTPHFPSTFIWLQPFYSKSLSFIRFNPPGKPLSCTTNAVIEVQYLVNSDALKLRQRSLCFFCMVMSKGHLVQHGHLLASLNVGEEIHNGTLYLTLNDTTELSPVAQVVLYTVLSNGEVIADSMNFPVELCLSNKVSLGFSESSALPGSQVSLSLNAYPGSLCSVRAIDQSLLLLKPESELSTESVIRMLPVHSLSGYHYKINDQESCWRVPFRGGLNREEISFGYFPSYGNNDVYSIFKYIGMKILTNAIIKKYIECRKYMRFENEPVLASNRDSSPNAGSAAAIVTIRTFFPETWLWDLVLVRKTGVMGVNKTVPDSITTWQADAFCTSPIGFGVAPQINLTAFQPFFVSLTMPSFLIRGEMFTLKATVFNYLQGCMMVHTVLADSDQCSAVKHKDCDRKSCLCANESRTFSWTITPHVLGKININVTAEAVQSSAICGTNTVTVPELGRIDTVTKTLLVRAEGTKQYETYNEILCPDDTTIEKEVILSQPDDLIDGSLMISVTVQGDPMGRALQNLANLLAMPYGCGEQNMIRFAPNIFILNYLKVTSQLTPAIWSKAETFLLTGYQRQLLYKHPDGSYSAFGTKDPSGNTWLTAFVMKSFGMAKQYIYVDQIFVDEAKEWLGRQQKRNGCFQSVGKLFHSDLKGGVNDEVTLSAYIISALLELSYPTIDSVINNGLTCLRNMYPDLNSTYSKALMFYAFTLAGDQRMRNILISDLDSKAIISGGERHWSRENKYFMVNSLDVEITSYVLLALMSGPLLDGFDRDYSSGIIRWLSQQQNAFGGYASTQDTIVALQALSKYSSITYSPSGVIIITVESPAGQEIFTVNQNNRLLYQQRQLSLVEGKCTIKAEGKGCAYIQFILSYNIALPPHQLSFSITASASGKCRVLNLSLEVKIQIKYTGKRLETNMLVIKMQILSGFVADNNVTLVKGNPDKTGGSVQNVEQAEGELIIYLNQLTCQSEMVYSVTIRQETIVKNLKSAYVKIYDYYETNESATANYSCPCTPS